MSRQDEDDAWRSIVENYGERAEVDPAPAGTDPEPAYDADDAEAEVDDWSEPDDERFVPPPPPPLPRPTPVRLAAWIGVFGAPAVLLVVMVLALPFPSWLEKGLVGYFVAGFLYLVFTMERGPRDPWDNGARV
ncbi:hypothetical protein [Nocardioides sp.]|uniref:hypothetical protein n=1 Tax=Nocardioides sp. TaxID=35761 RepID=UPI002D805273|nr:hypothetical protein [Nocardioides sp.]HET8960271.1 hypothetical protein [Nocardioides sp.]